MRCEARFGVTEENMPDGYLGTAADAVQCGNEATWLLIQGCRNEHVYRFHSCDGCKRNTEDRHASLLMETGQVEICRTCWDGAGVMVTQAFRFEPLVGVEREQV